MADLLRFWSREVILPAFRRSTAEASRD